MAQCEVACWGNEKRDEQGKKFPRSFGELMNKGNSPCLSCKYSPTTAWLMRCGQRSWVDEAQVDMVQDSSAAGGCHGAHTPGWVSQTVGLPSLFPIPPFLTELSETQKTTAYIPHWRGEAPGHEYEGA
ncbi:uncharacterized protein LACBIDRAFT_335344 [Laccaria bicolor S238N-H82]|uniref:Predicted protein n=1 Tax=Laccaria bicolor (strain S238N-H82 / ATCC MYA-4686) TaxID=486041 RepID=B0E222_LACBS|nr:uncharacterized protein LACBIDRAFT_335344 [Laccaria bicolor S238N-H82]EDQ99096.1 predicted protein [Laccaria bicolor S238N-H82]|eukprot:XP_001890229.1 predicted protein [Laccaria bicolor S238N-H82]